MYKAVATAVVLGWALLQAIVTFGPLKEIVRVFSPFEVLWILGGSSGVLSGVALYLGRRAAARAKRIAWPFIVGVGVIVAIALVPRSRFGYSLSIPEEYALGVAQLALCFVPAALLAHVLFPQSRPEP